MRHKSLRVIAITLIAGLFMNQQTKGCDDSKEYIKGILSPSLISSLPEIIIDKKELNQSFVDSWIDVESSQETFSFNKISILTIKECHLSEDVSYDIFNGFVNIQELNILKCNINSKCLNNLLRGINPYSLSKLDLSQSNFNCFSENDLESVNGLFSLRELVLPSNMDKTYQRTLEKLLGHPKIIEQPEFFQGENRVKEQQIEQLIQEKDETIEKQKNLIENIYFNLIEFKNISSKTENDLYEMIEKNLRLIDSVFLNKNSK